MNIAKVILLLISTVLLLKGTVAVCGYKSCPTNKPDGINVHLVPHSHDDVGWLKTVDEYYYGLKSYIQNANVSKILSSTVQELLKDPKRRFIYAESVYFFKWYNEQSKDMKVAVKNLVNEGRLEFVGGAWSVNDEAVVHYQSVIDQFTLGLKKLWDTFGKCGRPRIGWQIDAFGHSREMASLFAQMGYDGEFFARIDFADKMRRLQSQEAEMIWKASEELGERSEIFAGLLYNHYSAPSGFCFDVLCRNTIIDDNSNRNNVKSKVNKFVLFLKEMASHFRTDNLLITMGDDFNYQNATKNFENMDKLIKYVNAEQKHGSKYNLFYSTPSCYLQALHNANTTWPVKTQDFFPYGSDINTYWTGYYTSRPTLKRFERVGNHFLQVAKQLTVLAQLPMDADSAAIKNIDKLRNAMGLLQHHDAVTGTEKQNVAENYASILSAGLQDASVNTRTALQKLTTLSIGDFESCFRLNISLCEFITETNDQLVVTLFNPLGYPVEEYVRVPVTLGEYEVSDDEGNFVLSQLVSIPRQIMLLNQRYSASNHELFFRTKVNKLANYYIKSRNDEEDIQTILQRYRKMHPDRFIMRLKKSKTYEDILIANGLVIESSRVTIGLDVNGHLVNITMNGITENIRQDFYFYNTTTSGAYVFRPLNRPEILIGEQVNVTIHQGHLVKEVHQNFNDWVSQVIRIYEDEDRVEFEWMVGPIPDDHRIGQEVITRFTSNLQTSGAIWTDSNGREMIRHVRNEREDFKPMAKDDRPANYYPVTSRVAIQDEQVRFALLTDRAQGAASLEDGQLELMLHRRLVRDDHLGVNEILNERAFGRGLIARGIMNLVLSPATAEYTAKERILQQKLHLPLRKFFSYISEDAPKISTSNVIPKCFTSFPEPVNMLSLEPFSPNEYLLRFEHFMDHTEADPVTFNIRDVFDELGGVEIRETTLDGSLPLDEMKRLKFFVEDEKTDQVMSKAVYKTAHKPLFAKAEDNEEVFDVTLDPMQIRTFIVALN